MRLSSTCVTILVLWIVIIFFVFLAFYELNDHETKKSDTFVVKRDSRNGTSLRSEVPKVIPEVIVPLVSDVDAVPIIASGKSKFAYVSLMHGIDDRFGYRGFLYNALLTKKSLEKLGSTADFIVLVGFTAGDDPNNDEINRDLQLLRDFGVIVYYLPRFVPEMKLAFCEMALLKITPFNFLEYDRIQFLDGDVLPYKNMDCLFGLDRNTFNTGSASPVNSGWYLAIPNHNDYMEMKQLAIHRLTHKWDEIKGWGKEIPENSLLYRGSNKAVKKWDFNGASLDQGLVTHYFVLTHGRIQLLDTKVVRKYEPGYVLDSDDEASVKEALHVCEGSPLPTSMFYHYTGRNKPWLQDLRTPKDASLQLWANLLDGLNTTITSKNIHEHPLKPPLGFFHPNK